MRNLLEYPITHAEVLAALKRIHDQLDDGRIGDPTPLMITQLHTYISNNPQLIDEIFGLQT